MKLSEYARRNNITYRTAWEHFKTGKIPIAYKLLSGTIVVPEKENNDKPEYVITYARVSSMENKNNLASQSERLINFANANGWKTHENIKEIGSGLNDNRKKLNKILQEYKATKLIIEHKDRLCRFGFNYIEILCKQVGCELIVINPVNDTKKEDLMQDFVSIITFFCTRIYGLRRSKRKTEKIIKELKND